MENQASDLLIQYRDQNYGIVFLFDLVEIIFFKEFEFIYLLFLYFLLIFFGIRRASLIGQFIKI